MKELLSCCVLGLVALSGYAAPKNGTILPMAVSPESEGVSSLQVIRWLDACEQRIDCLHGFAFLRHGKVIAEGAWKPFDTLNEPHFLSSHTKCFISTAAGFLVDEGKLDLDERVIDVLPDKAPTRPSERLKSLRVRDLLTMNVGTKDEGWPHDMDGDWTKALLASEFVDDPGCQFKYNSGGTHVLGLIVARRSGRPLMDFLKERLFDKIGIEKAWTTCDAQGNACAGWGFSMTTREISLIGQLYLNKGVWQGKRLLSEDWVTLATCRQTWSGKTPTEFQPKNDWTYGFGFNWWRCQHGCYRADGSGGQYTIVFPKHDAVLSIHADVENMQQILDVVWTHFLPVFAKDRLPDAPKAVAELKARCASLSLKPVQGRRDGVDKSVLNRDFAFSDAPADIRGACLAAAGLCGSAMAADYFVAPWGDDSKDGLSWETAMKSPEVVVVDRWQNTPNHTLTIASGTYKLTKRMACTVNGDGTFKIKSETGDTWDGGTPAVKLYEDCSLVDSAIVGNSAGSRVALWLDSNVLVSNCLFRANVQTAAEACGLIFVPDLKEGSTAEIVDSYFIENDIAKGSWGCWAWFRNKTADLAYDVRFRNCLSRVRFIRKEVS